MNWIIKYHQCVENIRNRALDEGTTLWSGDEIILGKNDLPAGEILYSIIYLLFKKYTIFIMNWLHIFKHE